MCGGAGLNSVADFFIKKELNVKDAKRKTLENAKE
jgi:hypothetical protein